MNIRNAHSILSKANVMNFLKLGLVMTATLILVACGGGSSGSFDAGREARMTVNPQASSVEANPSDFAPDPNGAFTTQVDVRLVLANGDMAADGTTITLTSSSAPRGLISPLTAPAETGASATATTVGGVAQFWFTAGRQTGMVTLTASTPNPAGSGTISSTAQIEVVPATSQTARLRIEGATTMPANAAGVPIFLGSPYINELTVRYTGPDGNAGNVAEGQVAVAIFPVSGVAAFSTLDDPETDENEFEILVGSGPVNMTAGVTTLFIHSFDRSATATVTVTAQDAETGERFTEDFIIEIEDGAAGFLPAELSFQASSGPIYVAGTGATTTKQYTLTVLDSGGNPVPNPEADGVAYNNVTLSLEAPTGSGARLTGTGTEGSVSGSEIQVRSINGIVQFSLSAGSEVGPHKITATADRADNNVDNEVQDAVNAETTLNIGDGQLFALRIVSPILNAISVNPITTAFETDVEPSVDPTTGALIPPSPDGTYSFTVSAIGTDRAGNPPLPGQTIDSGKIDAPTTPSAPLEFVFSGPFGDPEEGKLQFSAENVAEGFGDDSTRPDEAVEPGDTLVILGKMVPGNREHEAARRVDSVVDDQSVTVTAPFNANDSIGEIVDDGAVIPWVIGRSLVGVVDSSFTLDEQGRGSIRLTYPINSLGAPLVLWAQGERVEAGGSKTVADISSTRFPGITPLLLTAQPSVIPGNASVPVTLCLTDGLGAPINNIRVSGAITDGTATGTLDGSGMPTATDNATGRNGAGCVVTQVTTTGMVPEGASSTVTFSVDEAIAEVEVAPPGSARLVVTPSQVTDTTQSGFSRSVTLQLLNADGGPITGVGILGSCDGGDGTLEIASAPGVTGSDGRTTASVFVSMAGCGDSVGDDSFPRVGTCEFTTDSGVPVGVFTATGVDLRSSAPVSPTPSAVCPPLEEDVEKTLTVQVSDNRTGPLDSSQVTSFPGDISCSDGNTGTCETVIETGTVQIILEAPPGTTPTWIGDCDGAFGTPTDELASVDTSADQNFFCSVQFNDP
jgi:hypothetical protein